MNGNVTYEGSTLLSGAINVNTTGNIQALNVQVTENGERTITPPEGVDGYAPITIDTNVPIPEPVLDSISITQNGTYTPPSGVDGFNEVNVDVPQTTLTTLDVTANGTYTAPTGMGYNEVSVNVPAPANALFIKNYEGVPTSIASFNDGTDNPLKSLTASIVPQQDLHGYDSPWVGGSGKNKLKEPSLPITIDGVTVTRNADGSITLNGSATNMIYIDFDSSFDSATYAGYIFSAYDGGETGGTETYDFRISSQSDRVGLQDFIVNNTRIINNGANLRFALRIAYGAVFNNTKIYPMVRADGTSSTFEPYSNICPINGWTEGEIEVRGQNLTDVVSITTSPNTGSIRKTNGTIYTGFVKGKTYTVSFDLIVAQKSDTAEGNRLGLWLNDGGTSLWRPPITAIGHQSFTFTATDDGFVNFWCTNAFNAEIKVIDNIQVEEGSVEHDYKPYTANTYTIPFTDSQGNPVEVYGGSVDVVDGVVTPCPYYASYNGEQLTGEWISDRDVYSPNTSPSIGAQVVNIGATGTPFNTQPTSIKSLEGVNNARASTGDVEELKYFVNL